MFGVVCGPYIDGMIQPKKIKKLKPHILGIDTRKSKGDKHKSRKEHREKYRI